ncbi:MAG TPA: trehalase family glycosidase [Mycobacteriales bacterium]|nr:trehalase family glycosidase [Mycobacteriales bacterium]
MLDSGSVRMINRRPAPGSPAGADAGPGRADWEARLLADANEILDLNWSGRSTVPSRSLYPHQWSWDSAFIAIGRSWLDQRRAEQELESLLDAQWANGMVPHIVFNPAIPPGSYFPGPDFWDAERGNGRRGKGGPATSGITQPPLHARAALEVYRRAADRTQAREFLTRLYPKLTTQHDYLARHRDPAGHGLAVIVHPWESGMDNAPIWDADLDLEIPPGVLPVYRRHDLAHADPADRPTKAAYDRFVYLALAYRNSGYDDSQLLATSPFLVEDPLFNSIWCWSVHALAEIAEILDEDPAPHRELASRISAGMLAHLWDPSSGRFHARDIRTGHLLPKNTISSLMPLLDPDLPAAQVAAILTDLQSPHFTPQAPGAFMVPSHDLAAPEFDRRRYWRGPVWINTDWLLWRGLEQHGRPAVTDAITASMVGLARRSGWREYFDPFTGGGYGADGFSWSAALIIDLLHSSSAIS